MKWTPKCKARDTGPCPSNYVTKLNSQLHFRQPKVLCKPFHETRPAILENAHDESNHSLRTWISSDFSIATYQCKVFLLFLRATWITFQTHPDEAKVDKCSLYPKVTVRRPLDAVALNARSSVGNWYASGDFLWIIFTFFYWIFRNFSALWHRICRNKRSPRSKRPPKTVIFPRGEYIKPMTFDGWFFTGGSTQNRWPLTGDFSQGEVNCDFPNSLPIKYVNVQ